MTPEQRHIAELLGTVDGGLPRHARVESPQPAFLLKEGSAPATDYVVSVRLPLEPGLPFLKIWASVNPAGVVVAGWIIRGEVRFRLRGRNQAVLKFDCADQTQSMSNDYAVSDFVSGVGAPVQDMILLNSDYTANGSVAGAIGLAPRHLCVVADEVLAVATKLASTTAASLFLRIDQSNTRF